MQIYLISLNHCAETLKWLGKQVSQDSYLVQILHPSTQPNLFYEDLRPHVLPS